MIGIEVQRDDEGRVLEIRCLADASEAEGDENKAVDTAVSTLMNTVRIGLERYLKLEPIIEDEPERYVLRLKRDHLLNREIDALLETALLGMKAIESRYPGGLTIHEASSEVAV